MSRATTWRPRQLAIRILLLVLLSAGCASPDINTVGGYVLVYQMETHQRIDLPALTSAIQDRLESVGGRGVQVQQLEEDKLAITLPGFDAKKVELAKRLIGTNGTLEFRILAKPGSHDDVIESAQQRGVADTLGKQQVPYGRWVGVDAKQVETGELITRKTEKDDLLVLVVEDQIGLGGKHLKSVQASQDSDRPTIGGQLTTRGAALMRQLTSANLPDRETGKAQRLGIILDGQLMTAPTIQTTIGERFQITGNFTREEVDSLVTILRLGRLPVAIRPQPISVRRVEPASPAD